MAPSDFAVVRISPALRTVAILALIGGGCRTREDAARKMARQGATVAVHVCRDAADLEGCRESTCRDQCLPFADSAHLRATCFDKCTNRGTCDSDADCGQGLVCVMIAPRVRRCEPEPALREERSD